MAPMRMRFLLVFIGAFIFASCATAPAPKEWINSNIAGNVAQERPSLKDDFYQYVNYGFLSSHTELPAGMMTESPGQEDQEPIADQIIRMLKDSESISREEELCKIFYRQLVDAETRNALGTKPILPYIERLQNIATLEEFCSITTDSDMPDCFPVQFQLNSKDPINSALYCPSVQPVLFFGTLALYQDFDSAAAQSYFSINIKYYSSLLVKCGWQEEEAGRFVEDAFAFEQIYARNLVLEGTLSIYSTEYMTSMFPNIPLVHILKGKGGRYQKLQLVNKSEFDNFNRLFTEENLESLKKAAILKLLALYARYLDEECQQLAIETEYDLNNISVYPAQDEIIYDAMDILIEPLSQAWLKRYFLDETKREVEEFIDQIICTYEVILDEADWMGDSTRLKAKDKLNAIVPIVGYGQMDDYADLELLDSSAENALIQNVMKIRKNTEALKIAYTSEYNTKRRWEDIFSPLLVNAAYIGSNNTINITAAILNSTYYSKEWSIERKLAGIGFFIGHEISHSFDVSGGTYDKDGNRIMWWDNLDYMTLLERSRLLTSYVASIEGTEGKAENPSYMGEITADEGSMAVLLKIAETYPDFNYEEFFTSFAETWCMVMDQSYADYIRAYDGHPLNYVRVNATLQLFDRFYETFGITEGDGMYLEPEKRNRVW